MLGLAMLGTGIEPPAGEDTARSRLCRIDREPVGSAAAFADHLRVIWLTPAMDQLFMGPASERRRFLDRLVLAVDAEHTSRVSALERSLRSRNRLLEEPRPDTHWLDAIEHETAELAVAVAAGRSETVRRLQGALAQRKDEAFPSAEIALDGWMEQLLLEPSRGRDRGALPHDPQGQPAARRCGRTHARRTASDRSRRRLCAKEHPGRRRLDRRAEGAADRAGAGACRAAGRNDRVCAGAAARRGRRPSRSRPPHGALRRARQARRAGLDDGRRSGGFCRYRRRKPTFSRWPGGRAARRP